MPTVLRWQGWQFFFYSGDEGEPAHVHVKKGEAEAKVWLHDISVAKSYAMNARDLGTIVGKVREHRDEFQEAWDAHFRARKP